MILNAHNQSLDTTNIKFVDAKLHLKELPSHVSFLGLMQQVLSIYK